MTGNQERSIASTVAFGILGAGLVYYGYRTKPGILATLATTIGGGLITKAVSSTVFAALAPSRG
jgi:uncharacterized membrane protein